MSQIDPKEAVSKNILLKKYEPVESEFNKFEKELETLKNLKSIKSNGDDKELEGSTEILIRDFLNKTFYYENNAINKKDKIDLAIFSDKTRKSVRVIIEVKSIDKKSEFPKDGEINVKAMQETLLYYLRESISYNNT